MTAFSVVGDIAKAHRRFKHAAKEHGYLACQVDAQEGDLWGSRKPDGLR